MDSVNSTTFIKRPPCMSLAQESYLYAKEILSGRIFLGCYEDRRYVPVLNDYRDMIIISPEETELHQDLDKIRKKFLGVVDVKWVGITGPDTPGTPKAYCFWVKLSNLPFGHYWFQIKHVKLVEGEIILNLRYIRKSYAPAHSTASQKSLPNISQKPSSSNKNEEADTTTIAYSSTNEENGDFDVKEAFLTFCKAFRDTTHVIKPYITWKNVFTVIRVTCALAITLVMGTISLIGHLGEYVLKLIRELSVLVNAFTPIIIQIIDFFSKIIGGFYILMARMFIRNGPHPPPQTVRQSQMYYIPYSSVVKNPTHPPSIDWRERNKVLRQELLTKQRRF